MGALTSKGKKWARSVESLLQKYYHRFNVNRYHGTLGRHVSANNGKFASYLHEQLEHTLEKKRLFRRKSIESFAIMEILSHNADLTDKEVLCIGARNRDEIDCFRRKGIKRVVGIDLYSDFPDIIVMDMHDLKFNDNSFDVVYSRHSYEHAYDKVKAAREFVRVTRPGGIVSIEVPGNFVGGADVNRFETINDVTDPFDGLVQEIVYEEFLPKANNPYGMDIFRAILRVGPSGSSARALRDANRASDSPSVGAKPKELAGR